MSMDKQNTYKYLEVAISLNSVQNVAEINEYRSKDRCLAVQKYAMQF